MKQGPGADMHNDFVVLVELGRVSMCLSFRKHQGPSPISTSFWRVSKAEE
jgi:hypothetical protein